MTSRPVWTTSFSGCLNGLNNSTFLRYILVGAVNTLFGYSILALLIFVGLQYSVALLIATVAGVVFNFRTFGAFVFGNRDWLRIGKFFVVYGVLYVLNLFAVFGLLHISNNIYIASALAMCISAIVGYLFNRRFVYEKS